MILSERRKARAIADLLEGREPEVGVNDVGRPWNRYYRWIREWIEADPGHVDLKELQADFAQYCNTLSDDLEIDRTNYALIGEVAGKPVEYRSVLDVMGDWPDLEWLWKGWMAYGMVSVIAAAGGTGKSYLALDLARRVINGSEFPDGAKVPEAGSVLYVDAEYVPQLIKVRVQDWERRELSRLFVMQPDRERWLINLGDPVGFDRERLLDQVCVLHPRMVIVDSYGSASSKGESAKEDVQDLLSFFSRVAVDHFLAVVLVHHLRKSVAGMGTREMTLDSVRGSSHIVNIARNVLGMQKVQTSEGQMLDLPRKLWMLKTNTGVDPKPLGVRLETHPKYSDMARLVYGEAPEPYREQTMVEKVQDWLLDLLSDSEGPVEPKAVVDLGEAEGFSRASIFRARAALEGSIVNTSGRKDPNNKWALGHM